MSKLCFMGINMDFRVRGNKGEVTIMWDKTTGRLYSLFWTEKDNFKELHREEITMEYAKHLCEASHDYIEIWAPGDFAVREEV